MTPQNQIHTVRIQDVEFHQPLPDAYKLIRLDDTGEIIHNLHIIPHLSTRQLTDRQVMLSRQKKRYHLYDAANLEHPLWNPPPSAAQAAYPSYDTDGRPLPQSAPDPAAHEVTIQDIRFYDLPPELYEHIVKSNNAMNRIAAVIAICIALPFFGFLIMALGREMLEYWFITLPVVAVITLLCIIVARNEKKNKTQPVLECVQVLITDSKTKYAPIRITFTVPETGQTVVDQRIDISYCGLQLSGMTVMLVRNEQNIYSIYPPDYRHR